VTDPLGNVSKVAYDLDHRETGTTDAQGHTTQTGYDADGLRTTIVDQSGNAVFYSLDPRGLVTQVQVPHAVDPVTSEITYDTTQFTYDQVGNNTGVVSPLGLGRRISVLVVCAAVVWRRGGVGGTVRDREREPRNVAEPEPESGVAARDASGAVSYTSDDVAAVVGSAAQVGTGFTAEAVLALQRSVGDVPKLFCEKSMKRS
jgi:YD repeat-containing protein